MFSKNLNDTKKKINQGRGDVREEEHPLLSQQLVSRHWEDTSASRVTAGGPGPDEPRGQVPPGLQGTDTILCHHWAMGSPLLVALQ